MTRNATQHYSVDASNHVCVAVPFFLVVLLLAGCTAHKRPADYWKPVALSRPIMPATVAPLPRPLPEESIDPVPELRLELPPPPPLLAVHFTPVKPHVAPPPSVENSNNSKPEVPAMVPQLTAEETNAARQQMNASLGVAQNNLSRAQGRRLNPTQSNLAGKIKAFIGDARSAEREGDWTRARSLATKAQVLSEELAASL